MFRFELKKIKTITTSIYLDIFARMMFLKKHIALFLLFVVALYSIDLHGLSHAFSDDNSNNDKPCKICILHHQYQENSVSILPVNDYFENQLLLENIDSEANSSTHKFFYQNLYFEGQLYNKPPPQLI